jgi:hypothetical protein
MLRCALLRMLLDCTSRSMPLGGSPSLVPDALLLFGTGVGIASCAASWPSKMSSRPAQLRMKHSFLLMRCGYDAVMRVGTAADHVVQLTPLAVSIACWEVACSNGICNVTWASV